MVAKKIGKYIIACMIYVSCVYAQDISVEIRVLDATGTPVTEAVVDSSLLMEVIAHGATQPLQRIQIDNLDDLQAQRRGTTTRMNSINGVAHNQSITNYVIHPDSVGTCTIGPAHVTIDGTTYDSKPFHLTVLEVPRSGQQQDIILQVHVDKQRAVIGERIPFSMKLYLKNNVKVHAVEPPTFTNIKDLSFKQATGTEVKHGVVYNYSEWTTELIPTSTGTLRIPAAKVFYSVPSQRRDSLFGSFSRLFDFDAEQKIEYSNVMTLTIDPLPEHAGNVDAIGCFGAFDLHTTVSHIVQGQAAVVALKLESREAMDDVSHPRLALPESFTSYESKSTQMFDQTTQMYTKTFEYIIQAQEAGDFSIAAQQFTFFDTKIRTYKTLTTDPLFITVEQAPISHTLVDTPMDQDSVMEEVESDSDRCALPWFEYGPWNEKRQPQLAWYLVILLSITPWLFGVMSWVRAWYARRQQTAYARALMELKQITITKQLDQVYAVFERYARESRGISVDELIHTVKDTASWNEFVERLQEIAYFDSSMRDDVDSLISLARMWLNYFEGR